MPLIRLDPAHKLRVDHQSWFSNKADKFSLGQGTFNLSATQTGGQEPKSSGFVSVVIPAHNEALNLPHLLAEVIEVLDQLCLQPCEETPSRLTAFEVIVVDDGSTDSTLSVLEELERTYSQLRSIHLQQTVGQSVATIAGFRVARGDWVVTLDADLQNDPADIIRLWNTLPGHDAVLGWRIHRADSWSKRVISLIANKARNYVLGQSIRDTGCSMRLFRRVTALQLPSFRGIHRFWGPLLIREGCHVAQIPVNHRRRRHGRSHYNLWNRSLTVVLDLMGIIWLMHRPIHYELAAEHREQLEPKLPWVENSVSVQSGQSGG